MVKKQTIANILIIGGALALLGTSAYIHGPAHNGVRNNSHGFEVEERSLFGIERSRLSHEESPDKCIDTLVYDKWFSDFIYLTDFNCDGHYEWVTIDDYTCFSGDWDVFEPQCTPEELEQAEQSTREKRIELDFDEHLDHWKKNYQRE